MAWQRCVEASRVADEIFTTMGDADGISNPAEESYRYIRRQVRNKLKKTLPPWREYFGQTKLFGQPDPDGYFGQLHEQQAYFALTSARAEEVKRKAMEKAKVTVRREEMRKRMQTLLTRNKAIVERAKAPPKWPLSSHEEQKSLQKQAEENEQKRQQRAVLLGLAKKPTLLVARPASADVCPQKHDEDGPTLPELLGHVDDGSSSSDTEDLAGETIAALTGYKSLSNLRRKQPKYRELCPTPNTFNAAVRGDVAPSPSLLLRYSSPSAETNVRSDQSTPALMSRAFVPGGHHTGGTQRPPSSRAALVTTAAHRSHSAQGTGQLMPQTARLKPTPPASKLGLYSTTGVGSTTQLKTATPEEAEDPPPMPNLFQAFLGISHTTIPIPPGTARSAASQRSGRTTISLGGTGKRKVEVEQPTVGSIMHRKTMDAKPITATARAGW